MAIADAQQLSEHEAAYRSIRYEWIPISRFRKSSFQRKVYPAHVNEIHSKFTPYLVSPPLVRACEEGGFDCVDGQHTLEVLNLLGFSEVYARVIYTSHEKAAEIFSLQVSKRLRKAERFVAVLEEDGEWPYGEALPFTSVTGYLPARDILETLQSSGFTIAGRDEDFYRPLVVAAILEIERILYRGHYIALSEEWDYPNLGALDHLGKTLKFIQAVWQQNEGDTEEVKLPDGATVIRKVRGYKAKAQGYFLNGCSYLIAVYPDFLFDEGGNLLEEARMKLLAETPQEYLQKGSERGNQRQRSIDVARALVRSLRGSRGSFRSDFG